MKYDEFIDNLQSDNNLTRDQARSIFRMVFFTVARVLLRGSEVHVPFLGTFKIRYTKGRKNWTHPATGEVKDLDDTVRVYLDPASRFSRYLNNMLVHEEDDWPTNLLTEKELEEEVLKE